MWTHNITKSQHHQIIYGMGIIIISVTRKDLLGGLTNPSDEIKNNYDRE